MKYSEDFNWLLFQGSVREAAGMTLEVSETPELFLRHYKVTRLRPEGEWKRFNIDRSEYENIPNPEWFIQEQITNMFSELFQPIIDLPWEDYLWSPEKKRQWVTNYDENDNIITPEDMQEWFLGRKRV